MKLVVLLAMLLLPLAAVACRGDDDQPADEPAASASSTTAGQGATPTAAESAEVRAFKQRNLPLDLADGQALGKKDAKLQLAVFEDFQCPFCLRFTISLEKVIVDEYVKTGKARLEFKHLVILGQESGTAAIGAACMAEQNRFWPMHERLFLEQLQAGQLTSEKLNVGRFSPDRVKAMAAEAGADAARFESCVSGQAILEKVQGQIDEARDIGARGTPALVINGKLSQVPADAAALRKLLDDALK